MSYREIRSVIQEGECRRRMFVSNQTEILMWYDGDDLREVEVTFDDHNRVARWTEGVGFRFYRSSVADGESGWRAVNGTPVLSTMEGEVLEVVELVGVEGGRAIEAIKTWLEPYTDS